MPRIVVYLEDGGWSAGLFGVNSARPPMVGRTLHLLCAPHPSSQGTQAWVHAGLEALASAGHDAHLLSYDAGDPGVRATPPAYTHHRLGTSWRVRSLRSGPSVGKIVLDGLMIARVRALARTLHAPVIAHNVEAAWVARAARVPAWAYLAHTRFETELPTYFPKGQHTSRCLGRAGWALDVGASRSIPVGGVSPALAGHFEGVYVPPAWPTLPPITPEERVQARAQHSLEGSVLLYAGNLDGYQGWPRVLEAAQNTTLVVATQSSTEALRAKAAGRSLELRVVPVRTEADRRLAYACADVALVPREAAGGLPIKLVDAMARGLPVAAEPRALAGLEPAGVFVGSLVRAAREALDMDEPARQARADASRRWVQEHACGAAFVVAFEQLMSRVGSK